MDSILRKAQIKDAKEIASMHALSWYETYKGLIPDSILENKLNSVEQKSLLLEAQLSMDENFYVLEVNDKIVGMINFGKSRDENFKDSGEIYAIYLLKEVQKCGLGKKMFLYAISKLKEMGYKSMILNVLYNNPTLSFYKKFGGKIKDTREDLYENFNLKEYVMYFDI